ncbi:hypothetical protein [Magpiepox virus]|nr:hypothetical protein [Magpiepox virus]
MLLCLNTTFFLIGNVSAVNIPFPVISKSRDPFIMIIEEKNNKTRCLNAISCDKFENSHGGKIVTVVYIIRIPKC